MSEAQHTPGPWHIGGGAHSPVEIFSTSELLAHCYLMLTEEDSRGVAEANARLFAAAPCMLAALKAVVSDPLAPVNTLAMQKALEVIAKAEGRS